MSIILKDTEGFASLAEKGFQEILLTYPLNFAKSIKHHFSGRMEESAVRNNGPSSQKFRGDRICWLNNDDNLSFQAASSLSSENPEHVLLECLSNLKNSLNRELFLGLREYSGHVACYEAGKGYARHRDTFKNDPHPRRISLCLYFNEAWQDLDGGQLKIYGEKTLSVFPRLGHGVIFLSEKEHEVFPALRERWSLAAWLK